MANLRNIKVLLLFAITLSVISCTNPSRQSTDGLVVVTDMLGREVNVPKNINKVVCLRAGALRLLVYLDAVKYTTGIEELETRTNRPYILAHPELTKLPVIGPSMGGDAELIAASRPDVIFITYTTVGDANALQNKTGIPVVALECPDFGVKRDTLFASLKLMAKVLHKESRADSLILFINQSIGELNKRSSVIPANKKPSVYVGGIAYSGAHGIVSTQPFYPPFVFANANNIASTIDKKLVSHVKGTYIDKEQLMVWNPDIIFIDLSGLKLVREDLAKNTALYNSLSAVKYDKMFGVLPYNNYAINYEVVLANAWYVAKVLYPAQFTDINIEQKADEILTMFLGKGIYKELTENTGGYRTLTKDSL
ncbi:MAG TPA: iron ABC transporter substrate-binding protein [Bacteroidales bacterium]|nr:iron ABC transporter substrate-binding protein [Bacteroidales bacterium]